MIDKFEVAARNAVGGAGSSTAMTVRTALAANAFRRVVEVVSRTVGHALVVLAQMKTLGAE